MLNRFLEAAAIDWKLTPRAMAVITCLPFAAIFVGAASALFGKKVFVAFTGEDGVAEYGQVAFYSMAFLLSFVVLRHHMRERRGFIASLYFVLSCGLFFLIGEELSWGQRLFGWATPETMEIINKQGETNLHNIEGVGETFKWLQLVVGAYGSVLPLVVPRWSALDRFRPFLSAVVPHFSLVPFFGLMFVWKVFRNLCPTPKSLYFVVAEFNEVIEFSLAMGFFFFMIHQLRQFEKQPAAPTTEASVNVAA
jgi:hypothetical protein